MKNFDIITNDREHHSKLVLKGLLVGIIAAFVVVLYRFALSYAEDFSFFIYSFIKDKKFNVNIKYGEDHNFLNKYLLEHFLF